MLSGYQVDTKWIPADTADTEYVFWHGEAAPSIRAHPPSRGGHHTTWIPTGNYTHHYATPVAPVVVWYPVTMVPSRGEERDPQAGGCTSKPNRSFGIRRIQLVSSWYPVSMVPSRGGGARPEAGGFLLNPKYMLGIQIILFLNKSQNQKNK